jgi:hypothetical protein
MTHPDLHDQVLPDGGRRPASTALVVVPGSGDAAGSDTQARRSFAITRHDPSFVTQLIATAAHVPQTRHLRRASPADAQSSYRTALGNAPRAGSRPHGTVRVA